MGFSGFQTMPRPADQSIPDHDYSRTGARPKTPAHDVSVALSQDKNAFELGKMTSSAGTAASFCPPASVPVVLSKPVNAATAEDDWAWVLKKSQGLSGEATAVSSSRSGVATGETVGDPGSIALQKIGAVGGEVDVRGKPPSDVSSIPPPSQYGDTPPLVEAKVNDGADSSAVLGDFVVQRTGVAGNKSPPLHVDLVTPPMSRRMDGPECVGISLNGVFGSFVRAASRPAGKMLYKRNKG